MNIHIMDTCGPLLEIMDISVQYGQTCILRVPSLRLLPGTIVVLQGPNGSGKSSLLCGLAGIGPDLVGHATYMFQNLNTIRAHDRPRQGLRLLPQGKRVFPRLTPDEHIRLAARNLCPSFNGMPRKTPLFLRPGVANRLAAGASGGEAKAILLTSLFAPGLRLLMLDEPFAGLDDKNAQYVLSIIDQAACDGTTMVIVDHTGRAEVALRSPVHLAIEFRTDGNVLQHCD